MTRFASRVALLLALFPASFAAAQAPAEAQPPTSPPPAQAAPDDPDPDDAADEADARTREAAREQRRAQREALREAARVVKWEAPQELREHFEKHVTLPESQGGEVKAGTLRLFLREVNRKVPEIAAAEGYFAAVVTTRVEGAIAGERHLVVKVEPGPRTMIDQVIVEFEGDVALAGDGREAQRVEVERAWSLPPGKPFRQVEWDDAKGRILEKLAERHYAAASMADSVAIVDVPASKATLKVILESGPRYTVGELRVTGLKRYPESLVRRFSRMKPGDPYEYGKLLDFQRALQNAPWFASVAVDIDRDAALTSEVPVLVSIVEKAPMDVGVALGYGTDNGARAEVSFRHRNAFGKALDMHSALSVDRIRQIGYVDFYLPALTLGGPRGDRLDTRDSFGALVEHEDNQGLRTERIAFAAYRQFKLRPVDDYRVGLSYQLERQRPEGAEEAIARALAPVVEATGRWVDDLIDPKKGGVLKLRLAGAGRSVLSTQDFVQTYAHYQHWIPLGSKDQLIVRAEVGRTFAASREGIPEDFLFRAGGARSNRGYAFESLGARSGDAVVGGRYLLTGSVEYVHWFTKEWGGAVFNDVGDAADERQALTGNPSYGVGARWRTPAGPLALDIAYAENTRKWRLAFSVSVAF